MTEELYKLRKDDSIYKKKEELYNKVNKIMSIEEFLIKFKNIFTSEESIKAIRNLENYTQLREQINIDIRKIKGEILKRERKINSLCYHDIIINDYCFICDSMCSNKDEYGIKINNVNNYYLVYNVIKKLFDENDDCNNFMKQVFEYAKSVQDDYNVKVKRRY